MKVTIYELLGMIKDGKPPKTIKSEGHYYEYNELEEDYYEGMGYDYEYLLANTSVKGLDNEIEIIEEKKISKNINKNAEINSLYGFYITNKIREKEEKKIPKKLDQTLNRKDIGDDYYRYIMENRFTINEIIDYLKEANK